MVRLFSMYAGVSKVTVSPLSTTVTMRRLLLPAAVSISSMVTARATERENSRFIG